MMIEKFWEWNSVPVMTPKLRFLIQGTVTVPMIAHGGLISSATGDQRVISAGLPGCISTDCDRSLDSQLDT